MRTLTNNWLHMAMTILLSVASNDITASKYPSTRSTPTKSAFHKVNKVDHTASDTSGDPLQMA